MIESKLKYIYDMKILNGINHIDDKKVDHTAEWNLPHGILNYYKRTKNINSHYSPIIHGCMNTHRGISRVKNF